jgi:hypothetical protein
VTSSWPIVVAVALLVGAAFWYDASIASASAPAKPAPAAAHAE